MARQIGKSTISSQNIAAAFGAGMQVSGADDTASNLRNWAEFSAYLTTFTNKRVAEIVLHTAQRVVPEDTSELLTSGHISSGDGIGDLPRKTVINDNLEGSVAAYAKGLKITGSFTGPSGFFGARVFNKHAVIFDAPHAAEVHETTIKKWVQNDPEHTYPDRKVDHFLLHAYNMHKDRYSRAMKLGMLEIERTIGETAAKQAAALPTALGAPRLIKRR